MRPMRIVCALILGPGLAWACLNDSAIPDAELEFRSAYTADGLDPLPVAVGEDPGSAAGLVLVIAIALLVFAAGLALVVWRTARMRHRRRRWGLALGWIAGVAFAGWWADEIPSGPALDPVFIWWGDSTRTLVSHREPAPYLSVPNDATPLRLAMVHDVLHQRYEDHGDAWYRHRLALNHAQLAALRSTRDDEIPSLHELAVLDDIAVGHERLGEVADALAVAEEKLALLRTHYGPAPASPRHPANILHRALDASRQPYHRRNQPDGIEEAWYRCYANLGTILVHASFGSALRGDPDGRRGLERGRDLILQALALKPRAHFGREAWQALAIHHILAAIDDPEHLLRSSMTGVDLDPERPVRARPLVAHGTHRTDARSAAVEDAWLRAIGILDPAPANAPSAMGADPLAPPPMDVAPDPTAGPVPEPKLEIANRFEAFGFDQPTMGLIGMWIYGGGPNPHSALALATLMEEVGHRHLAWSGYARAIDLGQRFWPRPEIRTRLLAYCEGRQRLIEASLAADGIGGDAPMWRERLQRRFEAELTHGRSWQQARHAYEAATLVPGEGPRGWRFYQAFDEAHGPIATDPGVADSVMIVPYWWHDLAIALWRITTAAVAALALGALGLLPPRGSEPPPAADRSPP